MSISEQLKPRYQSPLEWWYVHGSFTLEDEKEYSFILTIFRNQFQVEDKTHKEGFQFIISLLGPNTDDNWHKTLIDPVFFNEILNNQQRARKTPLDKNPLARYFSIVREDGPPDPIILSKHNPDLIDSPFSFSWDNLQLKSADQTLNIRIVDAQAEKDLLLNLNTSEGENLHNLYEDKPGEKDQYGMSYLVHPRINLTGSYNQQKIKAGSSWIDHQWGGYDWLYDRKNDGKIKGWNWLGISLKDGTDLIIWQHLDVEERTPPIVWQLGLLRIKSRHIINLNIIPKRQWFSHKTDCWFPVELFITIPELDAELCFIPDIDDQEIPVFGPMRSVWQGAGKISGKIKSQPVSGRARLELSGFSYIHKLKNHLSKLSERIDGYIEEFLPKKVESHNLNNYIGDPYWKHEPAVIEEMISNPVLGSYKPFW